MKAESGWQIASAGGYPAEQERVEALLGSLIELAVRAPIASQPTSYDSLQVGAAQFGKRVVLVTAAGVLVFGVYPGPLLELAKEAAEVLTLTGMAE